MWDLSSLTNSCPYRGSAEPLDHQGSPYSNFLIIVRKQKARVVSLRELHCFIEGAKVNLLLGLGNVSRVFVSCVLSLSVMLTL